MNIELRREQPADFFETENLTREAFWNYYTPGCCEHYLLHVMRESSAFIPELAIVADDDGKIVGNIIYTKGSVKCDNGETREVLTLGPIAVLPEYQRLGIARHMIESTRTMARKMGYRAVILCGDPELYGRFGFVPAEKFGIRTADNMYMAALQAFELSDGSLSGASGKYYEDTVFSVDEYKAAEFDKNFPKKEKLSGTPTQERFNVLAGMMKPAE